MIWILGILAACAALALPALGFSRLMAWGVDRAYAPAERRSASGRDKAPGSGPERLAAFLAGFARFL